MSPHVTFFKHQMTPVKVERHIRRRDKREALEAAYEVVNTRDRNTCWVTGLNLSAGAIDPKTRREHHHLAGRRVQPSWRHKPERIILVSALAHDLITRGWILVEGTDARKAIFFTWAAFVQPSQKVLVIKRRNMSRYER